MKTAQHHHRSPAGFTLIELLIVISIIALMSSMLLFALYSAQETARESKTKAVIARLDSIIRDKWESYRTRRVPITIGPDRFTDTNNNGVWDTGEPLTYDWNQNGSWDGAPPPQTAAKMRLDALREIIRMELPDCWTDVDNTPNPAPPGLAFNPSTPGLTRPSVSSRYLAKYTAKMPTDQYQNAECLYMIVMSLPTDDDIRETFQTGDIADTDGDGYPEFVDGWKHPIRFIRWPVGFVSDFQPLDADGVHDAVVNHDPFDPTNVYPNAYATYPLIYSAGPDGVYGVVSQTLDSSNNPVRVSTYNNNPFGLPAGLDLQGTQKDIKDGMGNPTEPNFVPNGWLDNIHNHVIGTR